MLKVNHLIGFGARRSSEDAEPTDPHFASVVLLLDWSDRGEGTDASFGSVVLLLDNSK